MVKIEVKGFGGGKRKTQLACKVTRRKGKIVGAVCTPPKRPSTARYAKPSAASKRKKNTRRERKARRARLNEASRKRWRKQVGRR
jgi:hypothetical protein